MDDKDVTAVVKAGIRTLLAAMPYAGAAAQAWSEYEQHVESRRIEQYFAALRAELQSMGSRLQSLENYFLSPEVPALIEKAARQVQYEPIDSKRHLFARAVARLLSYGQTISYGQKLSVLNAVDALTELDLQVLALFSQGDVLRVDRLDSRFNATGLRDDDKLGNLVAVLARLESMGLIGETSSRDRMDMFSWSGDAGHWTNRWREKYFELLPLGRAVVQCLTSPMEHDSESASR